MVKRLVKLYSFSGEIAIGFLNIWGMAGEKSVKKLKKKTQKVSEKGGKRKKRRKIEKKDAKRCAFYDVFSKSGIFLVVGAYRSGRSWWMLDEMLKWVN